MVFFCLLSVDAALFCVCFCVVAVWKDNRIEVLITPIKKVGVKVFIKMSMSQDAGRYRTS